MIDELGLPWSWCLESTPAAVAACKTEQAEFKAQALAAGRGDYWKQRNVAWCLSKGCGGLFKDQTLACAWRIVIIGAGSASVDSGDVSNMRLDCGRLDAAATFAAQSRARALFGQIYKRAAAF